MRKLTVVCIAGLLALPTYGRVFEVIYEGNTLSCNVISEDAKTCEVFGDDSGKGISGNLVIPGTVNDGRADFKVISIAANAFDYNRQITSVTIPDGIETIGNWAFTGCMNLNSAIIGNSVASIGEFAFNDCSLSSVTIPASVSYIGKDAFGSIMKSPCLREVNTESLDAWMNIKFQTNTANPIYYAGKLLLNGELIKDLVIPEGVETINANAFYNCQSLESVKFPTTIKRVDTGAFASCDNLKRYEFESLSNYLGIEYASVEDKLPLINSGRIYIGGNVCDMFEVLVWPENLKRVPPFALAGEKTLKGVVLPDGIEEIGEMAFYHCSGLSEINIPASVETIGVKAFDYCRNLAKVSFEGTPVSIGKYAFTTYTFGNPLVTDLYLTNANNWCSMTSSGAIIRKAGSLYINEKKVANLVLKPASGTVNERCYQNAPVEKIRITANEIKAHAFYGATMESLCLDVQTMGEKVFYSCKNLKRIYTLTDEPPMAPDNTFYRYDGTTLYVPVGAAERYKSSEWCWRLFSKIEETDFAGMDDMFQADYDESGIDDVQNDTSGTFNPDAPFDVYNLNGMRVPAVNLDSLSPGIYVIRQGSYLKKITVK